MRKAAASQAQGEQPAQPAGPLAWQPGQNASIVLDQAGKVLTIDGREPVMSEDLGKHAADVFDVVTKSLAEIPAEVAAAEVQTSAQ